MSPDLLQEVPDVSYLAIPQLEPGRLGILYEQCGAFWITQRTSARVDRLLQRLNAVVLLQWCLLFQVWERVVEAAPARQSHREQSKFLLFMISRAL